MIRRLGSLCVVLWLTVAAHAGSPPQELLSTGRVDEAVKVLRTRTSTEPKDAEAWHLLCRSYYAKGRWDDAINAGRRAIALNPASSDYHLWLGRAYGLKAQSISSWHWLTALSLAGKTRTEFERAVQLDGNNVSARTDLAEFYAEAPGIVGGGKDKARLQADELAGKDPAAAHWIRALIAEKDKDLKTAEREYRAAVSDSRGDGGRWLDLASFYKRTDRPEEMEKAVAQAITAEKIRGAVYYDAAFILFQSGRDLPNASELVRRYLASNNKVEEAPAFQAHYLLGNILEKQGRQDAAVAEYRAALELNRDFSDAQNALTRLSQP